MGRAAKNAVMKKAEGGEVRRLQDMQDMLRDGESRKRDDRKRQEAEYKMLNAAERKGVADREDKISRDYSDGDIVNPDYGAGGDARKTSEYYRRRDENLAKGVRDAVKRQGTGFKTGGPIAGKQHADAKMNAAMVKKTVKPQAMKAPMKKPMPFAAGGAAKVRKDVAAPDGMPKKAGGKKMMDCI